MHESHGHAIPLAARSRRQPKTIPVLLAPGDITAGGLLDEILLPLPSPPNKSKIVLDFREKMEKIKIATGVYGVKSSTARVC
jgi:hypothetical protein